MINGSHDGKFPFVSVGSTPTPSTQELSARTLTRYIFYLKKSQIVKMYEDELVVFSKLLISLGHLVIV